MSYFQYKQKEIKYERNRNFCINYWSIFLLNGMASIGKRKKADGVDVFLLIVFIGMISYGLSGIKYVSHRTIGE